MIKGRDRGSMLGAAVALLAVAVGSASPGRALAPSDAPAARSPGTQAISFKRTGFLNWLSGEGLGQEQARQMLEPIAGQPFQLVDGPNAQNRSAVTWTGMARLRAAWTDDAVLRIAFYSTQPFKLHFWCGQRGVVLSCSRNPQYQHRVYWTAMRTFQAPGKPPSGAQDRPSEDAGLALLATDDQRADRTVGCDYEIRCQAGMLVLTKGDIRILTVPLDNLPRDVCLEGQGAVLRHLSLQRGGPVPEDPIAPPEPILKSDEPAGLPWTMRSGSPGSFQRLDDGSVELTVKEKTTRAATVTMPLFRRGLYEVIVQLDTPSPESGVFLADEHGRPVQGVEFYRDKTTGLIAYRFGKPAGLTDLANPNPQPDPTPLGYVPQRPWLRLVLGGGSMRCFTSGDGVHWGQCLPTLSQGGNFMRIGLYCQPGGPPRRIGLRRLTVRRFDALMGLAPVELEERAEASPVAQCEELTDLVAWQSLVSGSTPPGVDFAAWRRACALASLAHGTEPPLAKAILEKLLEEAVNGRLPLEVKLRLLHQVTLLWDGWTAEEARRLLAHWDRLAMTLLREGALQDLEQLRRASMTASLWTQDYRAEPYSEVLARGCLFSLICRGEWNEADGFCRQLRFWNQSADPGASWSATQSLAAPLVNWFNPISAPTLSAEPRGGARAEVLLKHLVNVQSSKDSNSLVTELRAAVEEGEYRDAVRMITTASLAADSSLVPDSQDPRRFESLATTIQHLMQSHPQLKQAMNESLATKDYLEISRTIAQGDVSKVRNVAIQYYGTPAGADALRWLGERLMGLGEFSRAITCLEQARTMASATQQPQLAARLRLAAAMLGQSWGEPATCAVRFGDVEMPAVEFEKMVADARREQAADWARAGRGIGSKAAGDCTATGVVPGPGAYAFQPRVVLEGDWGISPEGIPECSRLVDWRARQLAVSVEDEVMLVANRFQVTALDPKSGNQRWTYGLGKGQGPAHAWPLVPMRPIVFGQRVFVRMLGQDGRPMLVCLETATGKLLWTVRCPGEIVSDPVIVQGSLMTLTIENESDPRSGTLVLLTLDFEDGKELGRKPLVEIGNEWTTQRACQVAVAGNKLLIAVAGALIYCDPFDEILWVRRSVRLPPAIDPGWPRQYHQPPLVDRGRAYVCHVGSRSVECVDVLSGRLHWERIVPGIRRVLDIVGDRVLVETEEGVLAIASSNGSVLWSHAAPDLLECHPRAKSGAMLCLRAVPGLGGQWCPILEWVDVQTGRTAGRCALHALLGKQPSLGPLVARDQRLWCFGGVYDPQGNLLAKRRLMELVASEGSLSESPATNLWAMPVDPGWPLALEKALPGWTLMAGSYDSRCGLLSPSAGMPEVLVTRAAESAVHLARQVTLPSGRPQLLIEVGHAPDGTSRFNVQVDGVSCRQWSSQPMKTDKDWQKVQVDLSAMAGRSVTILITQQRAGGGAAYAYWKTIELQPPPAAKPRGNVP